MMMVLDQVMMEETPIEQSQSNGRVENAVGRIQGLYRTMRSEVETQYGMKIPTDHPMLAWMIRHASMTLFRYNRGSDGMTPHRRVKGRDFRREVPKIGECVWYLKPKTKGIHKAEYRWGSSVWYGIREESGEYLIGTDKGVIK